MNFLLDGNNMKYVRILTISGILVACLLGCAVRRSDGVHDSEKSQERNELVWLTARTDAKITATTTVVDRWRKRIGRQAMRKQRIRIWILKPERSRSGGG